MQHTYNPFLIVQGCVFVASMHQTCRVHTTSSLRTYNSRPHVYYDSEQKGIKPLPGWHTKLVKWFLNVKSPQNIVLSPQRPFSTTAPNLLAEAVQHYCCQLVSRKCSTATYTMGCLGALDQHPRNHEHSSTSA